MIISHKYKFVFIGLPFSASSAISKELYLKYDAKPILQKHSLYYEFLKHASEREKKYFVFAVLRNPMEIVVSIYEKMLNNAGGNYTNKKLYKENGGHITKIQRRKFKYIHEKKANFQQFFLKFHTLPYDNLSSLTLNYCDYIIKYENLDKDYLTALKFCGIKNPTPLPVANKTIGKDASWEKYYLEEIRNHAVYVFGPFMQRYGYDFPKSWEQTKISFYSKILYKLISLLKNIKHTLIKRSNKQLSLEGTIYGDMQRNKKL